MSNLPIYDVLAQAFANEGVDTLFNLMGDGNMHWATAMSKIDGMRVFMRGTSTAPAAWPWATTAPPAMSAWLP